MVDQEEEEMSVDAMTHDEMIAVIAAHEQGQKIERHWLGGGMSIMNKWDEIGNSKFNFSAWEYRIVPAPLKPREWIIHINPSDNHQTLIPFSFQSVCPHCIRVREVLTETGEADSQSAKRKQG